MNFRRVPLPKFWLSANRLRLQIFRSAITLPIKTSSLKISDDVIADEFCFELLQSKILATVFTRLLAALDRKSPLIVSRMCQC